MYDSDRFAQLQQKFLLRLAVRLDQLAEQLDGVAQEPDDRTSLDDVMRGFHSLAGIGGTYGFPEITERARQAEHFCARTLRARRRIGPSELDGLRGSLAQMRLRAQPERPPHRAIALRSSIVRSTPPRTT